MDPTPGPGRWEGPGRWAAGVVAVVAVRATRLDQAWVFKLVAQRPVAIAAARSTAATATPAASDSRDRQHREAEHEGCGHEFFAHCISPSAARLSNVQKLHDPC